MEFAGLPPEINSARMYSGAGSGPIRAAAAAWSGLAAELRLAASSYLTVVSELTGESWLGPSSTAMAGAAAPYVAWMNATAGQAEQAAVQAGAAAGAYEAAFAATVPPPVIAANRAQLMSLIATNFLGQNSAAIAATEALYGEMWAQDVTAMYGYAASSATASKLTPFTAPLPNSDPAAVAAAGGTSAATNTQAALSQVTSAVPGALQSLASPLQAPPAPPAIPDFVGLDPLGAVTAAGAALSGTGVGVSAGAWQAASLDSQEILAEQDQLSGEHAEILNAIRQSRAAAAFAPVGAGLSAGGAPTSAAMGQAVSVGRLSVPPGWATAAPEVRALAYALPTASAGAAPAVSLGGAGTAFSQMALAGMGGSALAGTVSRGRGERVAATTERVKSPERAPGGPVTGIAGELRELAALHDEGILTDEEFNDQKRRLLER